MTGTADLPDGVTVFERGWLSANNILFTGDGPAGLVDSGYCTHAEQTLGMVQRALAGRPLELLINTHLHSDHCGEMPLCRPSFHCFERSSRQDRPNRSDPGIRWR